VTHEERRAVEDRWAESVRTTTWEGGTVVAPAFAIGRTQELLLVAEANGLTPYVDGMGVEVTRLVGRHPDFLRDPEAFRRATGAARFVTGRDGQRERIAADNELIVTTSGMLAGGPVHSYLPKIRGNPTNLVTLTGYQVEGTPGRELQEHGRLAINGRVRPVSARVESYDFSAHADREGLESFLDAYRGARVLVNHGDRCAAFAADLRADGYEANAPAIGERIEL
jgi:putative mRNA 3-end processing factor